MTRPASLIAAFVGLITAPAIAVITRDDVPIVRYEKLAHSLPGYCRLGLPDGGGVLIAPRWVLTAAHVAQDMRPGHAFRCGDEIESAARVIMNPEFSPDVGRHDLALIELAAPSKLVPVGLRRTPVTVGTVATLIGHYQGGSGKTGGVGRNPTGLRGATNRVAEADANWLRFVFDPPSSRDSTELEGVSGSGDSGAPAYLGSGKSFLVVGIGSRSADSNHDSVEQDYGDTDLYVPVASHLAWIDRTIAASGPADSPRSYAAAEQDVFDRLSGDGFAGAASVYKDGRPLMQRASGRANAHSDFSTTTKVDVASLAKPITAMAIFQLIERGRVHLDDNLGKWFPAVPADKQAVTVRQMLNHTSGLVDIPAGMSDYIRITQSEMQKRIFAEPLDFPPGTNNRYSNSGFNLLGMIVEKASGRPLSEYLQHNVFQAAGINASYDPEHSPPSEVADSATDAADKPPLRTLAAVRNGPFWGLWGAGGVFMSASDTTKLFRAFLSNRIVSRNSVLQMTRETVPAGSYAREGLGWTVIRTSRGDDFVSYTGGSAHSNAAVRFYPRGNVVMAVVANSDSPGSVRMARELAEPLVGADFTPIAIPNGTPPMSAALEEDVGAIRQFMASVAGNAGDRSLYLRTHFSPEYLNKTGEDKLVERLGNLVSLGAPNIITIFRRGYDSILIFETQESEFPRLYELTLSRTSAAGRIEGYAIRRVVAP